MSQLKLAYDPDTLTTKANEINKCVMGEDFCHYFGDKSERTELLPSLLHIEHYKEMLGSEYLFSIMVLIIKIGIRSRTALEGWKQIISVML